MSQKWYRKLEGDLFNKYPREDIKTPKILIQMIGNNNYRYYTLLNSIKELKKFLSEKPEEEQTFFEVIFGENKQKPRFDIDNIAVDRIPEMFDAFGSLFEGLGIGPENLLWYSSSNETKQSYHLVLPDYYFENCDQAKRLWYYVQENMGAKISMYVDNRIYSSTQHFRLLGSQKLNSSRPKILMKSWKYKEEVIEQEKYSRNLRDSLVGYVKDEKLFPTFEIEKILVSSSKYLKKEFFDDEREIIESRLGPGFQLTKIEGNQLFYKRIAPSYCPVCDKQHNSVGTYFFIREDCIVQHCYRAEIYNGKSVYIPKNEVMGLENFDQVPTKKTLVERLSKILIHYLTNDEIRANQETRRKIIRALKAKICDEDDLIETVERWYEEMEIENVVEDMRATEKGQWKNMARYLKKWGEMSEEEAKEILAPFNGNLKTNKGVDEELPKEIQIFTLDRNFAELFAEENPGYFIHDKKLYYFDGVYHRRNEQWILTLLSHFVEKKFNEAKEQFGKLHPNFFRNINKYTGETQVSRYRKFAVNVLDARGDERFHLFNEAPGVLPILGGKKIVANGCKVSKRTADDYWTFECPVEEHQDEKIDTEMEGFIQQNFRTNENVLDEQEFRKFCSFVWETLWGAFKKTQYMVFLQGIPGGGKNTLLLLLKKILSANLVKNAEKKILEEHTGPQNENGHDAFVVSLRGKRIVVVDELAKNQKFDVAKMKSRYGNRGDELSGRASGGEVYQTFTSHFVLWVSSNHSPSFLRDRTIERKIKIINTTARFVEKENLVDVKRGIFLADKSEKYFSPKYLFSLVKIFWKYYDPKLCMEEEAENDEIVEEETEKQGETPVKMFLEKYPGESKFLDWFDKSTVRDETMAKNTAVLARDIQEAFERQAKKKLECDVRSLGKELTSILGANFVYPSSKGARYKLRIIQTVDED